MHKKDTTLIPSLSIVLDGANLIANPTTNTINKEITCVIINNRLKVQTISKTFGGFSTTKGFLSIDSITVVDSIPQKVSDLYKYSDVKRNFGVNGKILPNLSDYFSQNDFLDRIQFSFECFEKFETKKRSDLVDEIKISIQQLKGTKEEIIANIQDSFFEKIEQDEFYNRFGEIFKDIIGISLFDKFNLFYQLRFLFKNKKESLLKASRRASYDIFKSKFDRNISHLNTTWKEISSRETKDELVVEFPYADEISNGQRDVLTFIIQLLKFKSILKHGKKYLLIIDEVFDYLDDANIIAAQYYLSNLLKKDDCVIYPILFTHLDPKYFRNYIFKPSLLNIQYLKKVEAVGSNAMKSFIAYREQLDKNIPEQELLYNDLSKFFFHYNPNTIDRSSDIPTQPNLKTTWAKGINLKLYVLEELNKYLGANVTYDPYAVSLGIRFRLEKLIYDLLDDDKRIEFIDTHQTDKKLKYAEEHSVLIPDAYYYLSAIHNDADHLKNPNDEKSCVYKLNHPVIQNIIKNIFNNQSVLTIDFIH